MKQDKLQTDTAWISPTGEFVTMWDYIPENNAVHHSMAYNILLDRYIPDEEKLMERFTHQDFTEILEGFGWVRLQTFIPGDSRVIIAAGVKLTKKHERRVILSDDLTKI